MPDSPPLKKGRMRLHVLAPRWSDSIAAAAGELGSLPVVTHATPEALLDAAGKDADGIILVENSGSFDLVRFLIDVSETCPQLPGIVLGDNVPVLAVKRLLTLPRWDMLEPPVQADNLAEALEGVCRHQGGQADGSSGQCWTITPSVGGAGATLIAVEMAYQLSQQTSKVCLVDLDFFDGACASYLNCPANLDPSALTQSPDRIDDALLQAFITRHKNGLHLLAAPRSDRLWNSIRPEAILKVLEITCSLYDHVIIDLPRWPCPWTAPVITGSDENMVMSELTVPALHAARSRAEELETLSQGLARPHIILNRMTKKIFGNTVTVPQAEEAIGRPVFATISSDWEAAVTAVNFGQAVSQAKSGSRLSRDVSSIIDTLKSGASTVSASQKKKKKA